jgi:hypothetical protein
MAKDRFTFRVRGYPNYSIGWNGGYTFNVYFDGHEVDAFSVMDIAWWDVRTADDAYLEAVSWLDDTIGLGNDHE